MSTPVTSTPPNETEPRGMHKRTPTNELQEQMQHMISLQYQQQRQYASKPEPEKAPPLPPSSSSKGSVSGRPPLVGGSNSATPTKSSSLKRISAATPQQTGGGSRLQQQPGGAQQRIISPNTEQQQLLLRFPEVADQEVGFGTLFLSSLVKLPRPLARTASSESGSFVMPGDLSDQIKSPPISSPEQVGTGRNPKRLTPPPSAAQSMRLPRSNQQLFPLASYGAVSDDANVDAGEDMIGGQPGDATTPATVPSSDEMSRHLGGSQQPLLREDHDFHYGNPDYHDPYAPTDMPSRSTDDTSRSSTALSYLWNPIATCIRDACQSDTLPRSLCFGAIDGMLTGSGIVATFCGMNLLDGEDTAPEALFYVRTVVVIFSAAACFADSVCMAMGHIWTTYVLASVHARQRADARRQLEDGRADAKGQLVDMFLSKGMLKIDAMSLADTLEGYPDLFLAAVTGESLANAQVGDPNSLVSTSAMASHNPQLLNPQHQREFTNDVVGDSSMQKPATEGSPHHQQPFAPNHLHQAFPSYGRLQEYDMEPDVVAVQSATNDSTRESLCMMLGFAMFAIVPGLLFLWAPVLLDGNSRPTTIHPNSLALASTAVIMWCLGVWKSRFLDSSWLLFGIEAVVVLLVCIAAAYAVGWGLRACLLPDDVVLQVASR